jgi:preprotein translocase subunit SecF
MKFEFTKYKKIYYGASLLLIFSSLFVILIFGLTPGIEFVGGSVLEVEYEGERPSLEEINVMLESLKLEDINIQPLGDKSYLIRTSGSDEETHRNIMSALVGAKEKQFESIGPAVGEELKNMSFFAILIASLLVIIYIAISFKESDGSVSSTKYGVIATGIAFLHDVLIVLGIFAFLGHFYGVQVTIPIAVALLTTLGYSINDTVVIFDRIRENLRKNRSGRDSLEKVVNVSLNETIGRSLGTSITTLFVLFALLFLTGATLYYFVLALILGIIVGTYSSVFLAGPLVVDWNSLTKKRK